MGSVPAIHLHPSDIREKVRLSRTPRLLLFVVDASGSMAGQRRLALAKGAVRTLLLDAYTRRDQVGLIAFRGTQARLVLPPSNSVDLAERRLAALPAGGRTPLAAALRLAGETITGQGRLRGTGHGAVQPTLILLSDGRANVPLAGGDPWADALAEAGRLRHRGIDTVLIDAHEVRGRAGFSLGLTEALGQALGATVLRLDTGNPTAPPRAPSEASVALVAAIRQITGGANGSARRWM